MRKRILLTSFILTGLIVGGLGYYSVIFPQIAVNSTIIDEAESEVWRLNNYAALETTSQLNRLEGVLTSSVNALRSVYDNEEYLGDPVTYYNNVNISGGPPGLYLDTERNEFISYNASAYKFAPWAFNESYQETYLTQLETDDPLLHVSDDVRDTVTIGASLDPLWKDLFASNPDVKQVTMGFANGVVTTYPFRIIDKEYDHTQTSWYPAAISGVKDVVVVLDRSGSMEGGKLEALKNSTKEIIQDLGGSDRFSIVAFSDTVKTFRPNLVTINDEIIAQSNEFLDTIIPGGTTDILAGMNTALEILATYGNPKHQKVVVFVTDGEASTGITDKDLIVEEIGRANGLANAELMMYAIGQDADYDLLTSIANVTNGYTAWYNSTENFTKNVPLYHSVLAEVKPNENPVWSTPYFGKVSKGQLMTVSQPVYYRGEFKGVMQIELSLNFLVNNVKQAENFPSEYRFVIDSGGITVMHPQTLSIPIDDWTEENSRLDIETLEEGGEKFSSILSEAKFGISTYTTVTNDRGEDLTYALAPLGATSLILATVVSFNDLLPPDIDTKVEFISISPIVLAPALGASILTIAIVTVVAPFVLEEEKKVQKKKEEEKKEEQEQEDKS